jgi:hypothetical protein
MKCDQCEMLSINGTPCHEIGCPNAKKTWVPDRGWVRFVECSVCGCDVELGESCDCDVFEGELEQADFERSMEDAEDGFPEVAA